MESNPLDIMKLYIPLLDIFIWSFHISEVTEKQNIGLFIFFLWLFIPIRLLYKHMYSSYQKGYEYKCTHYMT